MVRILWKVLASLEHHSCSMYGMWDGMREGQRVDFPLHALNEIYDKTCKMLRRILFSIEKMHRIWRLYQTVFYHGKNRFKVKHEFIIVINVHSQNNYFKLQQKMCVSVERLKQIYSNPSNIKLYKLYKHSWSLLLEFFLPIFTFWPEGVVLMQGALGDNTNKLQGQKRWNMGQGWPILSLLLTMRISNTTITITIGIFQTPIVDSQPKIM